MPGQLCQQPLLFGLAQKILVMCFMRLLIEIDVRTHWIASLLKPLMMFCFWHMVLICWGSIHTRSSGKFVFLLLAYLERDVKGIALLYHVCIANDILISTIP